MRGVAGLVAFVLLSGLVLAPTTNADDGAEAMDVIVVAGSRVSDLLSELSNSTTVINLAEIEAQNRASVLDLLRHTPGLHVSQPGGRGGVAEVFIRGGEANFTMVLLDGVRVNDPNNTRGGSFDFSTLNVDDIERIEIVRGPQSAIYGSDALSGVINIISKGRADDLGFSVHAEAGEDSYERFAGEISGPVSEFGGFSLRAATVDDGDATEGNSYKSDSVTGTLAFGSDDSWNIKLFGRYSDNDGTSFPEDSGGSQLAVLRDLDVKASEDFSYGLSGSVSLNDDWQLNFNANGYDHDDSYTSPGIVPGVRDGVPANGATAELDRSVLSAHVVGDITDTLRATVGVDYHDEEGVSDGYVQFAPGFSLPNSFSIDRDVTGVFGEFQYTPTDGMTLMASIRNDDPDAESSETTAKVGGLFEINDGRTTLRFNWGQGFKLPSFFALASPLVGNPDLKSETSDSADIGITQLFLDDRLAATVTIYYTEFTDLIDFDPVLFRQFNRTEVTSQGAEFEFDYRVNATFALAAELLYLDLDVKDAPTTLKHRPDWRGSVSMLWSPAEDWRWQASWMYTGEVYDTSVPTGGMMLDAYNRIDTTLTWMPMEGLDLLLSVDNLLDEDYEEAIGFIAPGRRARLALRYRF
jgi:outer membrane cobalamin receptor